MCMSGVHECMWCTYAYEECVHTQVCMCVYRCLNTHEHVHIRVWLCARVHVCIHVNMRGVRL